MFERIRDLVDALSGAVGELRDENALLRMEMEDHDKIVQGWQHRADRLEESNGDLTQGLESARATLAGLERDAEVGREFQTKTSADLKAAREDLKKATAKIAELTEENDARQESMLASNRREIELTESRDRLDAKVTDLETRRSQLSTMLDGERKVVARLSEENEENKRAAAAYRKGLVLRTEEVDELKRTVQEVNGRVGGLTAQNNQLETELESAREQQAQVEQELEAVLARVSEVLAVAQELAEPEDAEADG